MPLCLHELSIKFLVLAHKLVVTLMTRADILTSTVLESLYQYFEGVANADIESNTKVIS